MRDKIGGSTMWGPFLRCWWAWLLAALGFLAAGWFEGGFNIGLLRTIGNLCERASGSMLDTQRDDRAWSYALQNSGSGRATPRNWDRSGFNDQAYRRSAFRRASD